MKRWITLLTALVLMACALPAMAAAPEKLAFVSQTDGRFAWDPAYFSSGRALISRGSKACSIANALIAAFDVTDEDTAASLLRETLSFSASHHTPQTSEVDEYCLSQLGRTKDYPLISRLRRRYQTILFQSGLLHADFLQKLTAQTLAESYSALIIGRINVGSELVNLAGLCDWLTETGHPDAMLIVTMGRASMAGAANKPFGVPGAEHYLAAILCAGKYADTGVVYLVDSLPRGFNVPEQQAMGAYMCYPFTAGGAPYAALRDAYSIVRQQDTLLRLTPRISRTDAHLDLLGLTGYANLLLCIP